MIDRNNFFFKSQLSSNINAIADLINTNVFRISDLKLFQEPVFISIIIKLYDLLQKLRLMDLRLDFQDDIDQGDITDLTNRVRNSICHLQSPENLLDKDRLIKFVFGMVVGKGVLLKTDTKEKGSDYQDDIAFFYGDYRLYLKRHIIRAVTEAKDKILAAYPDDIQMQQMLL